MKTTTTDHAAKLLAMAQHLKTTYTDHPITEIGATIEKKVNEIKELLKTKTGRPVLALELLEENVFFFGDRKTLDIKEKMKIFAVSDIIRLWLKKLHGDAINKTRQEHPVNGAELVFCYTSEGEPGARYEVTTLYQKPQHGDLIHIASARGNVLESAGHCLGEFVLAYFKDALINFSMYNTPGLVFYLPSTPDEIDNTGQMLKESNHFYPRALINFKAGTKLPDIVEVLRRLGFSWETIPTPPGVPAKSRHIIKAI